MNPQGISLEDDDIFGPVISRYSREDALEDGMLVDVTDTAREAGFTIPVAMTAGVWERYVTIPKGVRCQDEDGRLWDILWMAFNAARRNGNSSEISFTVYVRNDNRAPRPRQLKCHVGGGDHGEPVITICLAGED
jgi:hypothetical protein